MKNKFNSSGRGSDALRPAILTTAVAAAVLAVPAPVVYAQSTQGTQGTQGTLEEVVITAQRRQENLQEVPVSVAAFSRDTLDTLGVSGTRDLPALVPGVQLVTSGPSAVFFVRGVGNSSAGTGEEGTNAFYVDGVFMPSLKQTAMKFNNIERVEVLKGPQGTLFGRNSSGGLVHVITSEPGEEFEAKANVGYASYDTTTAQVYVAGPLTDTLSADIAVTSTDQGEGWGNDVITGKDVALGWDWGVRSKWVWRPNDTAKVSLAADYSKSSDDFTVAYRLAPESIGILGTLPADDPYDTNTLADQFSDLSTYGVNLTAEFDLGWSTLTSITGGRKGKNHSYLDADMGPNDLTHLRVEDSETSFQEELRLASNDDGPLSWQTGLFLLNIKAELDPQTFETAAGDYAVYSTLETTSYAVFGEVSYDLTPTTVLTAGARYTRDKLEFEGEQVSDVPGFVIAPVTDSVTETEPTYRLALRQEVTENISLYGSYNRGYKSGTFAMSFPGEDPVAPQTIDAFEIGMKSELWENRLRLNLSAFHYEIDDYQVRSASSGSPVPTLLNAAEVEVDGFEVDFEVVPSENLRLFGSFSWMDSEFADFPFAPITTQVTSFPFGTASEIGDATGNTTPLAPEFSGNIGASYLVALGEAGELDLSMLYSYNDGYYFEADNRLEQPSFGLLNASISYRPSQHWAIELWGRNLENETYFTQKLTVSRFGDVGIAAAPRTYGVNVKYTY